MDKAIMYAHVLYFNGKKMNNRETCSRTEYQNYYVLCAKAVFKGLFFKNLWKMH